MNITKNLNNKSKSSCRVKTEANTDQCPRQDLRFVQDIFKPKKSLKSKSKTKISNKSRQGADIKKLLNKHIDSIESNKNFQNKKAKEGKQNCKKIAMQKQSSNEVNSKKKKTKKSSEGRLKTLSNLNQYNTSHSHSKDKSKSKTKVKTRTRCNTSRNNEPLQKLQKSQCMKSTKIVTQRSWLNEHSYKKGQHKQKQCKNAPFLSNKSPKKKKTKRTVTTFQNQNQSTLKFGDSIKFQKSKNKYQQKGEQQQDSAPSTFRRKQLRIKTQFSQRKQSFFDQNLFADLNVKCIQSVQEQNLGSTRPTGNKFKANNFFIDQQQADKCNRKLFQSNQSYAYRQKQEPIKSMQASVGFKKSKLVDQEIQTQRIDSKYSTPKNLKLQSKAYTQNGHSGLKCFKKMQELKWKVILLQLKQIQNEQQKIKDSITQSKKALFESEKVNKLHLIMEQLDSNVREVITGAEQFFSSQQCRNKYALQNPLRVVSALNSHSSSKKSLLQQKQKQSEIFFHNQTSFQKSQRDNYKEQSDNQSANNEGQFEALQFKYFHKKDSCLYENWTKQDGQDHFKQYNQNHSQSDKNLLEQLQRIKPAQQLEIEDFQEKQNSNLQQISLQKNLSEQFQRELDEYSSSELTKNKKDDKQNQSKQQIEMFELDIQNIENKRIVSLQVADLLMDQVAAQLEKNKVFLHMFLSACLKDAEAKQSDEEKVNFRRQKFQQENKDDSFSEFKIQCDKNYSLELLTRLLDFIQTEIGVKDQILAKINTPFGSDHLKTLKWVRQYYQDQQTQNEDQQEKEDLIVHKEDQLNQEQSISNSLPQQTTFLTQLILNDFQSKNMNELAHQQYFFNHCVYNCMNQIMDTLRPYGVSGKPCIGAKANVKPKKHDNFLQVVAKIARNFIQIISIKAGRTAIQQKGVATLSDNNQLFTVNKKTNEIMDRMVIKEQQIKWGNFQDYVFQNKYYLSEKIIEDVFLDECMLLFTQFLQ